MKRRLLLSFLFISLGLNAQDIHLSQYYSNQQNLNPSLIGNYSGLYRISSNYRNQWRQIGNAPITTSIISFDRKIYFFSDIITAGAMIVHDQFSSYGLNTTKIQITGAYKKTISSHELRGGVQVGYVIKSTDLSTQTFPNQWVYQQGLFNTSVDNRESNLSESTNYLDVNVGFAWSKAFTSFTPTVGFAISHINQPSNSYFDNKNSKRANTSTYHASLKKDINSIYSIEPKVGYWRTVKNQNLLIGGNIYRKLNHNFITQLNAGLLYRDGFGRNADAVIAIAGLTYKRFDIGISYDYNVGKLSKFSNGKSTFEMSLVFTAPEFLPKKLTIPCDRY